MGLYLNPNNEPFANIVANDVYVDKSGLIAYMNDRIGKARPLVASSRPRRFGKTLAAQMLAAYYSKGCDSRDVFKNLEIARDKSFEKHLNKYNVIKLDIQWMRGIAIRKKQRGEDISVMGYIEDEILKELRQEFPEFVSKDQNSVAAALADINISAKQQFIIIIDEWDCIFREDKEDKDLQKEYINFLRGLFKGDASDAFVKLAYITGILPIKKYGTQSALNNFDELTMILPADIAPYIGFTESEVKALCDKSGMPFSGMQIWYDGYQFDRPIWKNGERISRLEHVYCPNSVTEALRKKEFGSYWSKTETYESLKTYIEMNFDGLKDKVLSMLADERCSIKVNTFQNDITSMDSSDDVLTLLVHLGYLAYDSQKKEAFIPNLEVRESFESAIQTGKFALTAKAIDESGKLLEDTIAMDGEAVAAQIGKVHDENISAIAYNNELSLTTAILLAYYKARDEYKTIREFPTGKGFADIVFLPRVNCDKPALVIELKWNKDAQTALNQIKEKKYPESLNEYNGNLLLVGINYDKKTKQHQCKIEKYVV